MTEYIIIVALIAIGVFSMFGKTVRNQAAGLAMELSGKKADTQVKNAQTASKDASSRANQPKGMGKYNQGNDSE
ncbi:pilus assembly protein [Lysobacter pythonis]|uniref:Pilus assembly protein n=1 Tax=Solilutibacter pythonis TaxID=2483112 RepID=A0A3M2HXN3_9GAMM|nr:pilus assembly protein [Lysobacter pythonis]RMH93818.1 pilus assembly protein [Lysobacter pythonis]